MSCKCNRCSRPCGRLITVNDLTQSIMWFEGITAEKCSRLLPYAQFLENLKCDLGQILPTTIPSAFLGLDMDGCLNKFTVIPPDLLCTMFDMASREYTPYLLGITWEGCVARTWANQICHTTLAATP